MRAARWPSVAALAALAWLALLVPFSCPAHRQMLGPKRPWTGPFGGVPPFGSVSPAELKGLLEEGMATALHNVDTIVSAPEPPTFDTVLKPYERAFRDFENAQTIYSVYTANTSNDTIRELEKEMEPRFSQFRDSISQNKGLFDKLAAVYGARATLGAEEERLTYVLYHKMLEQGAMLDDASKARVKLINERLAGLYTAFAHRILHDEDTYVELHAERGDLAGLGEDLVEATREAARSRGKPEGVHLVLNTRSAVEPFLTSSTRRDLRERVFHQFLQRGANPGDNNTAPLIREILQLRLERSKLLGYETYVHYRLHNTMIKTADSAIKLLNQVWVPAVQRVKEEVAAMEAIAGHPIEAWDYRFYAEKVRVAQYALDLDEVKPYMQLHNMRDALFYCAKKLFGLVFTPCSEPVPVFHPDVKVYEVSDESGAHVGLWYFDPFVRNGEKHSGAWMSEYRAQERMDGPVSAIVSNNANFVKAAEGQPVLISFDDAVTLFHEFGHALHGLLSNCTYPDLSGTRVYVDYVEFPSQLLEHWLLVPEVLQRFALNAKGEALPAELLAKIQKSMKFNKGFDTVEYLASALVDVQLHLLKEPVEDVAAYERKLLAEIGMPKEIAMRHATHHFSHVWTSDQYASAYWSYLQSDVLCSDAFEAFPANGPFDAAVAARLKQYVFSMGNRMDPAEAYRLFRLQDPSIHALMRKRDFPFQ